MNDPPVCPACLGAELRLLVEGCGGDRSYTDLFYAEEAERILFAAMACDEPLKSDLTTPPEGSTLSP